MDFRIHIFYFLTLSHLKHVVFALESELESFEQVYVTVIDNLELYVRNETERLNEVKLISERLIKDRDILIRNHLDDPVRIFKLLKGLTTDLHALENVTKKRAEFQNSKNFSLTYPKKELLNKTAFVLTMIQNTYDLNLTQLANGVLNVSFNSDNKNYIQYSSPLTEHDCFLIGRYLCKEKKYQLAVVWFLEAFRRYSKTDRLDMLQARILEHISFAYDMLNNIKDALFWLQKLIRKVPAHPRHDEFLEIIDEYNQILKKEKNVSHVINSVQDVNIKVIVGQCLTIIEDLNKKACRGEIKIVNEVAKRLKCRYLSENHPFLKLAPVKLEELYLEPDVYLFHNVISDGEIEYIKVKSKPRLKKCSVLANTTDNEVYRIRLCHSTNLKQKEMSREEMLHFSKLYDRVTDITGMTTDYSEDLHVAEYSVGGFYAHHIDFWLNTTPTLGFQIGGSRIATVLFYLSSPVQGGATVFPHLGLNVYPVKGAALFWRNLYPSGLGDLDTVHASCPVIRGSKMIMTQWIHSTGQELSLPCNLKKEEGWRKNLHLPTLRNIMNTPSHAKLIEGMQNCRQHGLTVYNRMLAEYG